MAQPLTSKLVISRALAVRTASNMPDYQQHYDSFTWRDAQDLMDGFPDGHINIAYEAIERHVADGHGDQIAPRWIAKSGNRTDFTYAEMSPPTNRFANVLQASVLTKGDRVYALFGAGSRVVHRRPWHTEGGLRILSAFLRVRTRTNSVAHGDRLGKCADHFNAPLSPLGRWHSRGLA